MKKSKEHPSLLHYQTNALSFIENIAIQQKKKALTYILSELKKEGLGSFIWEQFHKTLYEKVKVCLHFHPERLCNKGFSVAEGLLADGIYKNQFETGISSGSPTAFPGGARDQWEKEIFDGAYHMKGSNFANRPKYGALRLMHYPDGPSPRFGSSYFILNSKVSHRSSYTFGGSQEKEKMERSGTLKHWEPVMAALLLELKKSGNILGIKPPIQASELIKLLTNRLNNSTVDFLESPLGGTLDSFVEAQIHGSISLKEDVEQLIIDPSLKSTLTESVLKSLCTKYDIQMAYHPGFVLPVNKVPKEFRGYAIKPLAEYIAKNGIITAAIIGEASNEFYLEPELWTRFGSYKEVLTSFRRIWHVLVENGKSQSV